MTYELKCIHDRHPESMTTEEELLASNRRMLTRVSELEAEVARLSDLLDKLDGHRRDWKFMEAFDNLFEELGVGHLVVTRDS